MSNNETTETKATGAPARSRRTRHGFWFGIVAGGLVGVLLGGTIAAATKAGTAPFLAAKAAHRFGKHYASDPELAREHARFAARFVLERVDATEEQQQEGERIVSETLTKLFPLAEEHRGNREAFRAELSRETIDPAAIESIRQSEMVLVEAASKELTEALTRFAQNLTPAQRLELVELARRFRH